MQIQVVLFFSLLTSLDSYFSLLPYKNHFYPLLSLPLFHNHFTLQLFSSSNCFSLPYPRMHRASSTELWVMPRKDSFRISSHSSQPPRVSSLLMPFTLRASGRCHLLQVRQGNSSFWVWSRGHQMLWMWWCKRLLSLNKVRLRGVLCCIERQLIPSKNDKIWSSCVRD